MGLKRVVQKEWSVAPLEVVANCGRHEPTARTAFHKRAIDSGRGRCGPQNRVRPPADLVVKPTRGDRAFVRPLKTSIIEERVAVVRPQVIFEERVAIVVGEERVTAAWDQLNPF